MGFHKELREESLGVQIFYWATYLLLVVGLAYLVVAPFLLFFKWRDPYKWKKAGRLAMGFLAVAFLSVIAFVCYTDWVGSQEYTRAQVIMEEAPRQIHPDYVFDYSQARERFLASYPHRPFSQKEQKLAVQQFEDEVNTILRKSKARMEEKKTKR